MPHDPSVPLSTSISDSGTLFHVSTPCGALSFPLSIVKQLSGLMLFDTTVTEETGDSE